MQIDSFLRELNQLIKWREAFSLDLIDGLKILLYVGLVVRLFHGPPDKSEWRSVLHARQSVDHLRELLDILWDLLLDTATVL